MAERAPHQTLRVPPVIDGPAGRVASLLRDAPDPLDDVTRARMERSLVQAWRTRSAAHVPLPRTLPSEGSAARLGSSLGAAWAPALVVAACAVVGAAGLFALQRADGGAPAGPGVARFELRIGEAAVQSGSVSEGQVLESGKYGHIDLDLRDARVDMARGTRVRFERLSELELRLALDKGHVDVDFHPAERGRQSLIIESRAARVRVLGTRFSVDVDGQGNTEVRVADGTVEVTPRFGGEPRNVGAGGQTQVRVDEGNAYERAVRSAIEENLRAEPGLEAAEAAGAAELELPAEAEGAAAGVEREIPSLGAAPRARVAPSPAAIARRLDSARKQLRQGRHGLARARLSELADSDVATQYRAEALTLIAESYTAQGQVPRATAAYRRVVALAAGHPAAHNAQFALARLLERYTDQRDAALQAYRRYLELAPQGALASQAREALCRLGGECR